MQVILDSSFARPGSVPIWGGKKGEFRDWTRVTFKVHLTPKYIFRSNKSLHLFQTHWPILPLFKLNLDFLQVVKVTKSGHHLVHDRASMEYGPIPGLTSQAFLHARLQRLTAMQISLWHQARNRLSQPLTSSVVGQTVGWCSSVSRAFIVFFLQYGCLISKIYAVI